MNRVFPDSRDRERHFRQRKEKSKEFRQRPGDEVPDPVFNLLS